MKRVKKNLETRNIFRVMLSFVPLLICLLSHVETTFAGSGIWTSNGPYGGTVSALVVDPTNPSTIYAGTGAGIYRSTDGGGSWSPASNGLAAKHLGITTLVINPANPSTLYAGTGDGGVCKSIDGAASWSAANTGLADNALIMALAIDPTTPSTLYVGTYGFGIFKSIDGGGSWSPVSSGLSGYIVDIAISSTNSSTLYAGTMYSGVFKSTDGGATWSTANTGLTVPYINALAISPTNSSVIYAATYQGSAGVFKSSDGGANWSPASTGLTSTSIKALAVDPTNPFIVYAGTAGEVFKTINGGGTWSPSSTGVRNTWVSSLTIDPTNPSTVYWGTAGVGVLKSSDGGGSWSTANTGIENASVTAVALAPTAPSTLYAGISRNGIFKSSDGSLSWTAAGTGLPAVDVTALAVDPTNPAILYAGTGGSGVFKSGNGGGSWEALGTGPGDFFKYVRTVAIDPTSPGTIYTGTDGGGVFKSTDGGGTWSPSTTGLTDLRVRVLAIDPADASTLYAVTIGSGVFKSSNGGGNWNAANTGLTSTGVTALAVDPTDSSILYAATGDKGVFKSSNGGESWISINTDLPSTAIASLAIDPSTSTIYVGTFYGRGVFQRLTCADSWSAVGSGMTDNIITALTVDPSSPPTVFAGTNGAGVKAFTKVSRQLTVNSFDPGSGVPITASCADVFGNGDGISKFVRTYYDDNLIVLTAPATHEGKLFNGWSGCDTVSDAVCRVTSSSNRNVTAVYGTLPPAPTGLAVLPGNGQARASWDAHPNAISYNLYYSTTPGVTKATGIKKTNVTSPCTITSLANGAPYYFVVTAVTAKGETTESDQVSAVPNEPSGMQLDMSRLYYKDSAGREINYDFSSGTATGKTITLPGSAIVSRPPEENSATFEWGNFLANDFLLSLDTTAKVATHRTQSDAFATLGASGGYGGPADEWEFSVSLRNFVFSSPYDHSFSIGGGSSSQAVSPSIDAGWFTGWHEGVYYDKVFHISANIENDFDEGSSWSSQSLLLYGIDPATAAIDCSLTIQGAQTFVASCRINNGEWMEVGRHTIASGSMSAFGELLPYLDLSTDTVSPVKLVGLTISSGSALVNESSSASYVATAYWSDGSTSTATPTWSITPSGNAMINSSTGVLTTLLLSGNQKITVSASYTHGGITLTASRVVTIVGMTAMHGLSLTLSDTGTGSVNSNPSGLIACTWPPQAGVCSTTQPLNTPLTLTATPGGDSLFGGWGGACSGCSGLSCLVTLDSEKSCSATFTIKPLVRITGPNYYASIVKAYSNLPEGAAATIYAQAVELKENIDFGRAIPLTLRGGYDAGFSTQFDYTTIYGTVTVRRGSLTAYKLILR